MGRIATPIDVEQDSSLLPVLEGMELFWLDSTLLDQDFEQWL